MSSRRIEVFKHLSFDIIAGETLGIIGDNGSGKSTLLKLIAGIFSPINGRIIKQPGLSISLLSLQLGFFPELSGHDNAVMGAIFLGKTQKEALERLPDIIEFSQLGNWINEPLKTYSSGMRARLGFSVAMEICPDVLLVDEVLGVGDQSFRQKSLRAMKKKMTSGQTSVFVSHNLNEVAELCSRVCWLDKGQIRMLGETSTVVAAYQSENKR